MVIGDEVEATVDGCLFRYSPSTGRIWRFRDRQGPWKILDPQWVETGLSLSGPGYVVVGIGRRLVLGHRLVWRIVTGEWPPGVIDHDNRKRADNRWGNLVCGTQSRNMKNTKRRSDNTSGLTGVSWNTRDQKWRAQININGRVTCIGMYLTKQEAIDARAAAAIEHGFHPNHGL